jgi:hypothetical protein
MSKFILSRLGERRIWARIWSERLVEPLHLNLASLLVLAFGSFRTKVAYDLILRPQHAWGLLQAADWATHRGVSHLTAIEFGVANGTGLINLAKLAAAVAEETGVTFTIVGFDSGMGMPPPRDFRDHPELYRQGDYPCQDVEALRRILPKGTELVIGDIARTVPEFLGSVRHPIGFVSFDVDYYWSTMEALRVLDGAPAQYLPWVVLYFDDIQYIVHTRYAGQLLAINDFNDSHPMRKIDKITALAETNLFRRGRWIHQMYLAHVFDHPFRTEALHSRGNTVLRNPYLR